MDELAAERRNDADLSSAYRDDPDFIERQYHVSPCTDLLAGEGVLGVARLIVLPSFRSERLHTFVYYDDRVAVTSVVGAVSLWNSIAPCPTTTNGLRLSNWKPEPFVASDAKRRSTTLTVSMVRTPSLLASWGAILAAARVAPSCGTRDMLDGESYRHRVIAQEVAIDAEWRNPDPAQDAPQFQLLRAYFQLLASANLFPEERVAAEQRRLRNRASNFALKQRKAQRKRKR